MSKFFCLPNLATDHVTVSEQPWVDFPVPEEILALDKDAYKKRWFNPETKHCLYLLAEGQNDAFCVSSGNQAKMLHGFAADYDGVFTEDIVTAMKEKAPGKFKPAYWCLSQSKKLHLVWLFDRPITVTGNAHANELLHMIATKLKAVRWGVGYDPDSELVTQVMDIGREWHVYQEHAFVPAAEIIMWDAALFKKNAKKLVDEVVDIPFEVVVAEIKKRKWPIDPPETITVGTRCVRFWDPGADNSTGAQFMESGIRVYTPHDGGFKSWKSLLGPEFCEAYTAVSMAPFYEDTTYCHTKDEYWRFFRNDRPPHYEKRTEKVLRRDLVAEAMRDPKAARGEALSQVEQDLYAICRRNTVDHVAPILFRPSGRIFVPSLGSVLNTSLVTVVKPAERLAVLTPREVEESGAPKEYRENPSICAWDNPLAVRNFPHIHRFLTCLFMNVTSYNTWKDAGYPIDGQKFLRDTQLTYLVSWMAHFYRNAARLAQNPARGTVLILAGATGIGKSFFAKELLGQLMGGAEPADKMYLEGSRFNASLASKPVHLIDDKLGSKSQRERLKFTEALKVVAANGLIRYEAKFGSAVEGLPWPGRVVILSNVDTQSLSVLPDLDMSTRDKFTMLRLGTAKYAFGSTDENQAWLAEELPYLGRFLLGWRIPEQIRDDRFGVKAVQHADMAQASAENGLTQILVEVLETCIDETTDRRDEKDRSDAGGWVIVGNAVKIYKWIVSVDPSFGKEVVDSRTLNGNLQTLCKSGGYNIEFDAESKRWKIPYNLRKSDVKPLTPPVEA